MRDQEFRLCSCKLRGLKGTGAHHRYHHNIANGCDDGHPQPDGVAGELALLVLLGWSGEAGVEVGGGRLKRRVAVVWRIHEGPADCLQML